MNRAPIFDIIRSRLGKLNQTHVTRIDAVLDGLEQREVPLDQAAYILATAHHESDGWRTLTEYASGKAYEWRKDLGNVRDGDGVRFKGRGLVQITGRRNYFDWSKRLGVDLVASPSLASELKFAVPILIDGMLLGTFTGKKLPNYFTSLGKNWVGARRVVNGLDKASLIAGYAQKFYVALNDKDSAAGT